MRQNWHLSGHQVAHKTFLARLAGRCADAAAPWESAIVAQARAVFRAARGRPDASSCAQAWRLPMAALPCIVFDVNETLLDLETMAPTFERIFGDRLAMRLWFANFILYSTALTVANSYV